jgi:hypothetical protein
MLRQSFIALAAFALLGSVTLIPSAASAHPVFHGPHFGHFPHFHGPYFGVGFYGPGYVDAECYQVRRPTPYGWRWSTVCE